MSIRQENGQLEKQEVTVHVECHRQLEQLKAEREAMVKEGDLKRPMPQPEGRPEAKRQKI